VGGLATYSVLDVAQTVQRVYSELYGKPLHLERPVSQSGETRGSLTFCCERLQALGFLPQVSLEEGIRETLQFCYQHFADR